MTKISTERKMVTLINTFKVKPERADELAKYLAEITDSVMMLVPGFISANIHVSIDKKHVANYAQWESMAAFQAMLKDEKAQPHLKIAADMSESFEPIVYTVASVQNNIATNGSIHEINMDGTGKTTH